MLYTSSNLQIAMTLALAEHLTANGYKVFWQATGDTDDQSALFPTEKGTVTLLPSFPENPSYIVTAKTGSKAGLNGDSTGAEEVVVPALSLRVIGAPKRIGILGLGHKDYEWEREISIDGIAVDEFQQRDLVDLLHVWLQSEERKEFAVARYDVDPANPPTLSPLWIEYAAMTGEERYDLPLNVRYQMHGTALLHYVE